MRATLPASSSAVGQNATQQRLQLALGLVGVIWVVGLIGHFTPLGEWPALFIYVIGALAITVYHCRRYNTWQAVGITRRNLGAALKWGGIIGGGLMLLDLTNTFLYYRSGGAPMAQMEQILVGMGLLYLFPVLIVAEEWLWRGMLFSALLERGVNRHLVVVVTTLLYMLNHYAVAPVGLMERSLMAIMALPIGIIGGYLVLKTRNVWGSVTIHMLTMISMILDIFVVPALVR